MTVVAPQAVIDEVRRRLVALAVDLPFRFQDNTQSEAEAYLGTLTTFEGYEENTVAAAEARLGVAFPKVFRAYLLGMGRKRGQLFCGSDVAALEELERYKDDAMVLLRESGVDVSLPAAAVVFLAHQGYTFLFLIADGTMDAPTWQYVEGDAQPRIIAESFADLLDAELSQIEANARIAREHGGYYVTVEGGRIARQVHPARSSGDRPLDHPQQFKPPPWRFWK